MPAGRAVENGYRWDIIICPGTKNKYHKYGSDFNAFASFLLSARRYKSCICVSNALYFNNKVFQGTYLKS